jgi:hypothetical protein
VARIFISSRHFFAASCAARWEAYRTFASTVNVGASKVNASTSSNCGTLPTSFPGSDSRSPSLNGRVRSAAP